MKRTLLVVAAVILFVNTLVVPTVVRADGGTGTTTNSRQHNVQAVIVTIFCTKDRGLAHRGYSILRKQDKARPSVAACSQSRYSARTIAMLQAHSFLWYYLWLAPNLLLIGLAILLWRRGLASRFPAFLAFAILSAAGELAAFLADIVPSVTAENFWRTVWIGLLVESLLKFLVIGEIFSQVFRPYPSIGRLGKILVSGFGGCLVLLAALVAAFSHDEVPRGSSPVLTFSNKPFFSSSWAWSASSSCLPLTSTFLGIACRSA